MSGEDVLPRLLSGRYRLESVLGQGGMGVVYGGVDLALKRPVAVKLIASLGGEQLGDEVAERFLREAKNTARLHHEHIIELFDLGRTEEGSLYFVMELLVGESLSARIRREKHLSVESAVHIGVQICSALNVAHATGIVHRDLKPANIMLISRAGDQEFVKVLDFGVAKSITGDQGTKLTATGMLVGTIDYMAPEQIMGKPVDARTDIYSFGVLLYRMLTGHPPFRDNGVPALVNAHLTKIPPRVSTVVPGVPSAVDRIVLRCLAKAPKDRFASMAQLAAELAASLGTGESAAGILDQDDPYEKGDRTVLAPPKVPVPSAPITVQDALVAPDEPTLNTSEGMSFDETTIQIGAKKSSAPPPRVPSQPVSAPPPRVPSQPVSAPPQPRPVSNTPAPLFTSADATRPLGAHPRTAPITCAMCHHTNPPHARICGACGVSLAGALSAPPPAQSLPPVQVPPPALPYSPPPLAGDFVGEANEARVYRRPQPPSPDAGRSIWQRLLDWTGLRNR